MADGGSEIQRIACKHLRLQGKIHVGCWKNEKSDSTHHISQGMSMSTAVLGAAVALISGCPAFFRVPKFRSRIPFNILHTRQSDSAHCMTYSASGVREMNDTLWTREPFSQLVLLKSFSSFKQARRILISWKARGVKWWTGNETKTRV
jgi:hypothetical protein